MNAVFDPLTGLKLGTPDGWRQLDSSAATLLLVKSDPSLREHAFQPNAVATVIAIPRDVSIIGFTEQSTRAWMLTHPTGHVMSVDLYSLDQAEGRRTMALYEDGGKGVAVVSYLFVENAIATRVDVSFGFWDLEAGKLAAEQVAAGFRAPITVARPATTEPAEPEAPAEKPRRKKGLFSRGR